MRVNTLTCLSIVTYNENYWGFQKLGEKRYQMSFGKVAIRFEFIRYNSPPTP